MPDSRGGDAAPGAPLRPGSNPPRVTDPAAGAQPARTERQIEQLLDVYTQLFQAANRDQAGTAASAAPPGSGRGSRAASLPAPTAPIAPETLSGSGLSLMQVCDLILKQLY